MKKYYLSGILFNFIFSALQAQDDYTGRYYFISTDDSTQTIEFEICVKKSPNVYEQTYVSYKNAGCKNLNSEAPYPRLDDIIEIHVEMETGHYYISDTLLLLFSDKDNLKEYEFGILDSLNLEVFYSKNSLLKAGDMIRRIC
jgi:hypothetical protein